MRIKALENTLRVSTAIMALALVGCESNDDDADITRTDQDALSAYKMTTNFLGDQSALSATVLDGTTTFTFDTPDNLELNQRWTVDAISNDTFRIYNQAIGNNVSLDVINDGVFESLTLNPTEDVSGQIWEITRLENGYCRLTNQFTGSEIALDVTSDTSVPTITMRSVDDVTGQFWKIEQVGAAGGPIDGTCSGT